MKHTLTICLGLLTLSLLACQCDGCAARGVCMQAFKDGSAQCHINMDRHQCKLPTEKPRKAHMWIRQSHRTALPRCKAEGYQYKGKLPIKAAIRNALRDKTHVTLHKP